MPKKMTRYTVTESPVMVLRSSKDWPEWYNHILKAATLLGVWEYCDPATEKEDLPVLKEPKRPAITDDDPCELDETELEDLKAQASKYRKERLQYNEKRLALERIEELIRRSTSHGCWDDDDDAFWNPGGPWKQLRHLSDRFGRPTEKKLTELEDQWRRLRDLATEPVVEEYIRGWESLFKQCVDSRIVKSSSKSSRDKILLNAVMEPPGEDSAWALETLPWIEIPYCVGWTGYDDDDNEPKKDDGYWDFLSNADAETTDDKGRSRSPSVGWVSSGSKW